MVSDFNVIPRGEKPRRVPRKALLARNLGAAWTPRDDTRTVATPGFHEDLHVWLGAELPTPGLRQLLWAPGPVGSFAAQRPLSQPLLCLSAPRAAHALPALQPGALGNTSLRRTGVLLTERAENLLCRQQGGVQKCLETERSDLSGSIFCNSAWQQAVWGANWGEVRIGEGPARRLVQ